MTMTQILTPLPNGTHTDNVIDPEEILSHLTLDDKIAFLSGDDAWHTYGIPRLGVPRVRVSDGPNGVRGVNWLNSAPSACFPCATGLGASFDLDLAKRVGAALGAECRARGVHCLLGPTTNIQRDPRGGRGFESFAEDPHHSGSTARAWVEGVQSQGVMTCPKHLVCNEQELNRRSTNSVVDIRTLHEIYLEPFRLQCMANPATFMTSYNRVNGLHASEDSHLLRDILRGDYGFKGMIMSDWGGTYSSSEAVKATMDLEMPGPAMMRGASLERDVCSGKLDPQDIDTCVLNVLRWVRQAQLSGIPFEGIEGTVDTPAVRNLMREAASAAVVVLKNEADILPLQLKTGTKIAVIGPNAKVACVSGGGSASLTPTYKITPFEAIEEEASRLCATVSYSIGCDTSRWTPLLNDMVRSMDGVEGGMTADFFTESPFAAFDTPATFSMVVTGTYAMFTDGVPRTVPIRGYIRVRTIFTPDATGTWCLGLTVAGQADLYVDGQMIVANSQNQKPDVTFFNTGAAEVIGEIHLERGKQYTLEVRFSNFRQISAMSPYAGRRGALRIGGRLKRDANEEIARSVQLSKEADLTVLCIGLNGEWESESYDRDDIRLPGRTDDLVRAVLAANPNTVIVNQSGMPVEMPWVDSAPTVLQAFFGGNECGTGIADILFGRVNPSGKLPFTWPKLLTDYPAHSGFGHPKDTVYSEGLKVGYRYFDRAGGPDSLFAYGHGLSYTAFAYSAIATSWTSEQELKVSFKITNTGSIAGAESAMIFVHECRPQVWRPELELAGYTKTSTLQPGESAEISVSLDIKAFSYFCTRGNAWIAHRGAFDIRVGASSIDVCLNEIVQLKNSWTWVGLREPTAL